MIAAGPAVAAPLFGVSDGPFRPDEVAVATQHTQELGAHAVRLTVDWAQVQGGGPETYDWAPVDQAARALRERGIATLLLVVNTPSWARDGRDLCLNDACPPAATRLPAFEQFVRETARRYTSGAVPVEPIGLEVWNEPNFATNWQTARGPDAARYAALLRAAIAGSRAAAPALPVVLGGLVPMPAGGHALGSAAYLQRLYDDGAARLVDGIGVHVYPREGDGSIDMVRGLDLDLAEIRPVRDHNGASTPLWLTEVGIKDPSQVRAGETQGDLLLALYDHAAAQADVATFFVYRLIEDGRGWGLLDEGLHPKASFTTLAGRFAGATGVGAGPGALSARRRTAAAARAKARAADAARRRACRPTRALLWCTAAPKAGAGIRPQGQPNRRLSAR